MSVLVAQSPVRCRKRATTFVFFFGFQRLDFSLDFKPLPFFQLKRIPLFFACLWDRTDCSYFGARNSWNWIVIKCSYLVKFTFNLITSMKEFFRFTLHAQCISYVTKRTAQSDSPSERNKGMLRGRVGINKYANECHQQQIVRHVACSASFPSQTSPWAIFFSFEMCYLSRVSWLVLN